MTVTSTNYSSLEEVWGESFNPSSKVKKEKRKKVVDPICELYEMGNNNGYTENDLISYANSFVEQQEKSSKFARGGLLDEHPNVQVKMQAAAQSANTEYDVPQQRTVVDQVPNYDEDIVEQEPELEQAYVAPPPKKAPRVVKQTRVHVEDYRDAEEDDTTNRFAFIDLLLYIVSGIILIFVMEQFVKIGLLLQ